MSAVVKIRVVNVGQAFGCVGQLVRRGKVVAETDVVPYGMRHVAYQAAEALAAEMGVKVAS